MYWLALLAIAIPSLVMAARPGVSSSRRILASALVLLIPVIGVVLAVVVRRVSGGHVALEPVAEEPPRQLSAGDMQRLGETPPILDRLLSADAGERLEALVALSSAGDAEAVSVLRWAIEHGPSEVVLDCALTLEEIELRGEGNMIASRELVAERVDADMAIAAGDACARPVMIRIADPCVAPALADQARTYYGQALEAAPDRASEIAERMARLELTMGRPRTALDILDRLIARDGAQSERIVQLRDHAAFAAREFAKMSVAPGSLEVLPDLAARSLQTVLS